MSQGEAVPAGAPAGGPRSETRRSRHTAIALGGFLVFLVLCAVIATRDDGVRPSVQQIFNGVVDNIYQPLVKELLLNPWFYAVFGLVLVLEHFIPAREEQKSYTLGTRFDLLWMLVWILFHATLLPVYSVVLRFLFDQYLGFLRIGAAADWPLAARVTFALLFADLMFWLSHFLRHKLEFMWRFHAIHHSQREMNFFTDYRSHPFDDLFIYTINFIPILMVERNFATVVAIIWLRHWHTRFYHSNIRTNLGLLRYILVTPQSHRIHHSMAPEHWDKNFGLTFSLWDQLFGTQYRGWDEYPETGVEDAFPVEQEGGSLRTLLAQLFYPFKALRRG